MWGWIRVVRTHLGCGTLGVRGWNVRNERCAGVGDFGRESKTELLALGFANE
jgi:ribosomal protein L37E